MNTENRVTCENTLAFHNVGYRDDLILLQSELEKANDELLKARKIISTQRIQLQSVEKNKVLHRDAQMKEAAEIMVLQQKALERLERENEVLKNELNTEEMKRKTSEGRMQSLKDSVREISNQFSSILSSLSFEHDSATGSANAKVGNVSKSVIQSQFETLSLDIHRKLEKRDQNQKELKLKIEEINNLVLELNVQLTNRKNQVASNQDNKSTPVAMSSRVTQTSSQKNQSKDCMETLPSEPASDNGNLRKPPASADIMIKLEPDSQDRHGVDNVNPLNCLCGRKFPHKTGFRKHLSQSRNEKWLQCSTCGKHLLGSWALTQHCRRDHCHLGKRRDLACSRCGQSFGNRKELQSHKKSCCQQKETRVKVEKTKYKIKSMDCPTNFRAMKFGAYHKKQQKQTCRSVFLLPHI